jgi:hypothetical protein
MKAIIETQYVENYGYHAWDGEGECPQYWKPKGGNTYIVTDIPIGVIGEKALEQIVQAADAVLNIHKWDNSQHEYVIDSSFEEDNFIPYDEKLQMEYSGKVTYKCPRVSFKELGF